MAVFRHLFGTLLLAALTLSLAGLFGGTGCVAPETTLQGAAGEYCNGADNDCQAPLTCVDYVCVFPDDYYWDECDEVCTRTDDCNVSISNCRSSCANSTRQWSEAAIEDFVGCFVDDLSCEDLEETENPPLTCYRQLELPDARNARCDTFVESAEECGANSDELEDLQDECRYMGRTRSDEIWAYSDECVERLEDGVCNDIYHCLNETFQLDDPGLPAEGEPEEGANDPINMESNQSNFINGESGG